MNRIISEELIEQIIRVCGIEEGSVFWNELRNAPSLQPPSGQVGEADRLDDAIAMWVKGQINNEQFRLIAEEVVNALRQFVETVVDWVPISQVQNFRGPFEGIDSRGVVGFVVNEDGDGWDTWGINLDDIVAVRPLPSHSEALRTQLQAPVCPTCGGTWKDDKNGTCGNVFHCYENKPQAPVVEVSKEYVKQYMETELPEYGVWTDDVIDAIHALLQSKGGR